MIGSPTALPRDIERAIVPVAPSTDAKVALAADTPQSTLFSTILERSIPSLLPTQMVQVEPVGIADWRSEPTDGPTHSFAEASLFNTRATAANVEHSQAVAIPLHSRRDMAGSSPQIALHDGVATTRGIRTFGPSFSIRSADMRSLVPLKITPQSSPIARAVNSRADAQSAPTLSSQTTARSTPRPIKRIAPAQRILSPIHIAIAAIENGFMIAARIDRASPDCADRLAQEAAAIADEIGVDIAAVTVNGRNMTAQGPRKR